MRGPSLPRRRSPITLAVAVAVAVAGVLSTVPAPAGAAPSGVPSAATARSYLGALAVAAEGPSTGYSRDLFPHWITISGTCDTRETVLQRDGMGVVAAGSCAATAGSWHSPYDGATWRAASDVDIDHVVPLAEAWRSGDAAWTTSQRRSFANDLAGPALIAVTDDVNAAKGDKDPSRWQPLLGSYRCMYARMWIGTKHRWALSLQPAEKSALAAMLDVC